MAEYKTRQVGAANTKEYSVYFEKDGVLVSPFHDIPLIANDEKTVNENAILNMVVEIPRWTNAKLEIIKEKPFNPIKQDTKKDKLRFVRNCFPHKGYIWNYGAFPQTWENPSHKHPETGAKGDNDPLDVIEIGEQVATVGQIKQVKVLGIMALLDEGETDWKVIVIDVEDPLAPSLNDIEDVEKHLPGLIRATNEWFRIYKIPDGKPENVFAFSGEAKNKKYAIDIISETHDAWKSLIDGSAENDGIITLNSTSVTAESSDEDRKTLNDAIEDIPKEDIQAAASIDPSVDKWYFISGQAV